VGGILAMIISGFLTTPLIALLGTINLLFIAMGGLAVWLLLLLLTIKKFDGDLTDGEEEKEREVGRASGPVSAEEQWRALLQNRYILLIFLYAVFSTFSNYMLDFIFISEADRRFTDVNTLAQFFGNFLGVSTLILLFVSLISGKIFTRYGLKVGLLSNPIIVALITTVMAILGILFGWVGSLFWLVGLTKLFDDVLVVAMTGTSTRILYQPLPSGKQISVQAAVESIVTPLSIGLIGVMLLLFGRWQNFTMLDAVYILLAILIGWMVVAEFLNREYIVALKGALSKRHLGGDSLLRMDRSSINLLQQGLTSAHAGVVIYSLDMLSESAPELLPSVLPDLLGHDTVEVRVNVLERIEELQLISTLPAIKERMKEQDSWLVQGASLRTLAVLGDYQTLEKIFLYLEHQQPLVRQGAIIGLLRSGEIEAMLAAGQKLLELISSPDPTERCFAAQVLGEGGIPFVRPLLTLLQDSEPQVQQAALIAAGKLKHQRLWPEVVKLLVVSNVRSAAMSALIAGGEAVLTHIKPSFLDLSANAIKTEQKRSVLIRLIKIYGRVGGAKAIALLEQHLDFSDNEIRFHLLRALNQCGYQAANKDLVLQAIKADLADITCMLAIVADLGDDKLFSLLSMALTSHIARYRTRLFLWLSFIYDHQLIRQLQDAFRVDDVENKAYAIEILETLIIQTTSASSELSILLSQFLDDESKALKRLSLNFPQPKRSKAQCLQEVIQSNKPFDSWTRACAIYTVGQLPIPELTRAVIDAFSAAEPLVRETALCIIAKLDPQGGHIDHLLHDPDPQVLKTVRYIKGIERGEMIMLSMFEKILALKSSTFFIETKEHVLIEVAAVLEEVELKAGEILFKKGDMGHGMYIMDSGEIRLHDGPQTFEVLGKGGAFGELALLDPAPRSGQATAISDCRLLHLDAEAFYELIGDYSEVARAIMQVLARRLRRSSTLIA